ncbi:polysaccharide lyase [Sinomicrobium sp. M5D2P17]
MKKPMKTARSLLLCTLLICGLSSCNKDMDDADMLVDEDMKTTARAVYSSRTVNFNNRSHGNSYWNSWAQEDFGDGWGWNSSRTYVSNQTLRVTLIADAVGGGSGMTANVSLPASDGYEVSYQLRFHSAFDWSRGGKLGFGLLIGDRNTGCDRPTDGNGGSARLMWYNDYNRVYFRPYLYYRDQPEQCGDHFGLSYPSSGSISRGTWYTVVIRVESNTGSSANGRARITVNNTTLLDENVRWTTNDSKRLINALSFHTFRGGSQSYWESDSVGYIYYDNVSWNQI